jgi:DNA-binding MarR family transcriptional regulator
MQATVENVQASEAGATAGEPRDDRGGLIRDMYALASYLMRASNVGTFNRVAELDLSFTQIKALCTMDLDESEPSLKGLAESMKVSLPAMSRAVDGLYVRGLVDRCEDPEDRRMKRIRPTEAGRAVSATLNAGRLIGMQEFLTSLDDDQARALGAALRPILADRPEIAALRPAHADLADPPHPELVDPLNPETHQEKGVVPR